MSAAPALQLEPHAVSAEQELLGAMMINADALDETCELCTEELFFDPLHRRIFNAACELRGRGEKVTPLRLKARLASDPGLLEIEREHTGTDYISMLCRAALAVSFSSVEPAVSTIKYAAKLREALHVAGYSDQVSYEPEIEARPYIWTDPSALPVREWLSGRHLIRKFTSASVAPGGVGKSTFIIAEALAMVTGRPLLGHAVNTPLRVWLWNLEDPLDEIARRIQAACLHYQITAEDIQGRLFVSNGRDQPCVIAWSDGGAVSIVRPLIAQIVQQLIEKRIDVLSILLVRIAWLGLFMSKTGTLASTFALSFTTGPL